VLFDSHCHLYFEDFDADYLEVMGRMAAARVGWALVAGIDAESSAKAEALARRFGDAGQLPRLCYSAGLHPTSAYPAEVAAGGAFDAAAYLAPWLDSACPPVAIGECGIDLYWKKQPLDQQQRVFAAQLELARERGLPVIVHSRSAGPETRALLEAAPGVRGVLHCFDGSPELLEFGLSAPGWYVSFAGNVTYPKAEELRAAARQVPLERLLVETDAPFLAPQERRGKRNEPAFAVHTAKFLAELYGVGYQTLAVATAANALALFDLG
jgi:TatD DNase family protein